MHGQWLNISLGISRLIDYNEAANSHLINLGCELFVSDVLILLMISIFNETSECVVAGSVEDSVLEPR